MICKSSAVCATYQTLQENHELAFVMRVVLWKISIRQKKILLNLQDVLPQKIHGVTP